MRVANKPTYKIEYASLIQLNQREFSTHFGSFTNSLLVCKVNGKNVKDTEFNWYHLGNTDYCVLVLNSQKDTFYTVLKTDRRYSQTKTNHFYEVPNSRGERQSFSYLPHHELEDAKLHDQIYRRFGLENPSAENLRNMYEWQKITKYGLSIVSFLNGKKQTFTAPNSNYSSDLNKWKKSYGFGNEDDLEGALFVAFASFWDKNFGGYRGCPNLPRFALLGTFTDTELLDNVKVEGVYIAQKLEDGKSELWYYTNEYGGYFHTMDKVLPRLERLLRLDLIDTDNNLRFGNAYSLDYKELKDQLTYTDWGWTINKPHINKCIHVDHINKTDTGYFIEANDHVAHVRNITALWYEQQAECLANDNSKDFQLVAQYLFDKNNAQGLCNNDIPITKEKIGYNIHVVAIPSDLVKVYHYKHFTPIIETKPY